jgi:histidinol-phosphatase (PHP family)
MKANYHTHLHFCNHAEGNARDYVEEALKHNFEAIGISDHAPNKKLDDPHVRMKPEQLIDYIKDIDAAIKQYGDKIKIYKGLEVEFFYNNDPYYKTLQDHLEYLVHGQHYISLTKNMHNLLSGFALSTKKEIKIYGEYLCDAMDSGYFDIMAHPDLYMCGYKDFDDTAREVAHQICKKALETNSILEYNGNGFNRRLHKTPQGLRRQYPRNEFWEIAKSYGVKTIFNSDCHSPENLYNQTIKEAELEYKKLGLNDVGILEF